MDGHKYYSLWIKLEANLTQLKKAEQGILKMVTSFAK